MQPGDQGWGRWPCELRNQLRAARAEKAQLEAQRAEIEQRREEVELELAYRAATRPSSALLYAAAQPDPPRPHLVIRLPIEGSAEVEFVAADYSELARLMDWLDHGRYSGITDQLRELHD